MKIRFLGTGAAEGVPAVFCGCENCISIRAMGAAEIRTRSQVVIDDDLSVDFPPEAFVHSLKYGVDLSRLKYLLVTHSHCDHFYAHDFILRGYKYAKINEPVLEIYGNAEVGAVFAECTSREMKPSVAPNLKFNRIGAYRTFEMGDYKIISIPARHGNTEEALLYYIEKRGAGYLHLYDTGIISDEAVAFLAKCGAKANAVAFDCTFGENESGENSRHMGLPDNMKVKDKLLKSGIIDGATKLVITHFSHNCNPMREKLSLLGKEYGVIAAYDGFTLEI